MSIDKLDIEKVKSLIDLMEERNLLTLEVTTGDDSIKLTKYYQPVPTQTIVSNSPNLTAEATVEVKKVEPDLRNTETSPMVGVFYSSPSPSDPPFISVGQKITAGDKLGIIEAMKIMNPLEATKSGVIKEILVNNSDIVEFGQPLIRYES